MPNGPHVRKKRQIAIRLIHDGVQPGIPLDEPMRFGVQDTKAEVHPGLTKPGDARNFDLTLDVKGDEASPPVFSGPFAHGPPSGRFLYLSWKREGEHEHPWCWRIKIPLSGIGWAEIRAAEKPGNCLAAKVVGRRPYSSEPITWRIESLALREMSAPVSASRTSK
jgi:hypothetical protein